VSERAFLASRQPSVAVSSAFFGLQNCGCPETWTVINLIRKCPLRPISMGLGFAIKFSTSGLFVPVRDSVIIRDENCAIKRHGTAIKYPIVE